MKHRGLTFFLLATLLLLATFGGLYTVHAQGIRGGETVVIPADEIVKDDLYVTGQVITVDGIVKGDLIAMGQTIVINGVVEGDLMGMAQSIVINGEVQDDVRGLAAVVTVQPQARIGDDFIAMGYSLETQAGSEIGGNLLFAGNQALIAGAVDGNVTFTGNNLRLQGPIQGNVKAEVEGQSPLAPFMAFMPNMPPVPIVPPGLTVEDAEIGGKLSYSAPAPVDLPANIDASYTPLPTSAEPAAPTVLDRALAGLRRFISIVLVGLLLLAVLRRPTEAMLAYSTHSFGQALLWGAILFFVSFPIFMALILAVGLIVAVLYLLTLGGLGTAVLFLGLILLTLYALGMYIAVTWFAQALVSLWLGRIIIARINPAWEQSGAGALLLGACILAILLALPYAGGLIGLLVAFIGLGALYGWARVQRQRTAPVPTQSPEPTVM